MNTGISKNGITKGDSMVVLERNECVYTTSMTVKGSMKEEQDWPGHLK
jgi:hypothetical protein